MSNSNKKHIIRKFFSNPQSKINKARPKYTQRTELATKVFNMGRTLKKLQEITMEWLGIKCLRATFSLRKKHSVSEYTLVIHKTYTAEYLRTTTTSMVHVLLLLDASKALYTIVVVPQGNNSSIKCDDTTSTGLPELSENNGDSSTTRVCSFLEIIGVGETHLSTVGGVLSE